MRRNKADEYLIFLNTNVTSKLRLVGTEHAVLRLNKRSPSSRYQT